MKKYIAECIGTFVLTFLGCGAAVSLGCAEANTAAVVGTAIAFGLYFTMVPEREDIEFVKPAPREAQDDLLDDGFDPVTELGMPTDTAEIRADEKKMKEYASKAEQIFRKRFTKEAENILSKIYNNDNMNSTEKAFRATSQSTMEDLVRAQAKIGSEAGLNDTRSQLLASEIIEMVTNRLKSNAAQRQKAPSSSTTPVTQESTTATQTKVEQQSEKPAKSRNDVIKSIMEQDEQERREKQLLGN